MPLCGHVSPPWVGWMYRAVSLCHLSFTHLFACAALLRSFDAVGGVSAEANNESVAALAGIDPADLLMAEWCVQSWGFPGAEPLHEPVGPAGRAAWFMPWCEARASAGCWLHMGSLCIVCCAMLPPRCCCPPVQAQQPVQALPLRCAGPGQPVRGAVHQVGGGAGRAGAVYGWWS